jgi:thiamine biosynthesis lipoprotein
MGTTFRVVLYARDHVAADHAFERAFRRIAALDETLSDYRESSELSRITREAVAQPVRISDDLFNVLNAAGTLGRQSDGAFDITIGSLSRLWRRARRQLELPSSGDLEAALAVTGYRLVTLDAAKRTVRFARTGIRLDAGGIAKGYAADRALEEIAATGGSRRPAARLAAHDSPPAGDAQRPCPRAPRHPCHARSPARRGFSGVVGARLVAAVDLGGCDFRRGRASFGPLRAGCH